MSYKIARIDPIVLLTFSLPTLALDRRHGEFVRVSANEIVDDTLVATGNTVVVEGVINLSTGAISIGPFEVSRWRLRRTR